ncbi:hypothetical protein WMY93_018617 [Mugilogobius chulae]|uniref:Zinc finger protein 503 n=1 Tax=Mugilogobius chulae TaxID=88201 RepID=A0AAW0NKI5_9GOBI
MSTSPSASILKNSDICAAWERSSSRNSSSASTKPFLHSAPPCDPLRQANRLPIKVLKMLTARSGHILHPEYLQPLPSTPVSPIELDAKKSPLALLAQTCSQIGKPDPPPSSKLSSVTPNGSSEKESKSGPLKLSDIGVDDKSSFKPYSKPSDKKDSSSGVSGGEKSGFRVPSATCQPFSMPTEGKCGERDDKKEGDSNKNGSTDSSGTTSHSRISVSCGGINVEVNQHQETTPGSKNTSSSESSSVTSVSSASVLGSGLVAPVSPYKPGQTVFPLPPAGMTYPGSLAGAYAAILSTFCLTVPSGRGLTPSIMSASLCRDPYCLSYHCATAAAASALKSSYPLMYPTHPIHGVHSSAPSFSGHPLYPYGFMLPNDPLLMCLRGAAEPPTDSHCVHRGRQAYVRLSRFLVLGQRCSSGHGLSHAHASLWGPWEPRTLALRSPHHALGLSSRYHPYSKSPLPTPGAPVPVPAATGPYYSPYALYGQRLTTASALGYQ